MTDTKQKEIETFTHVWETLSHYDIKKLIQKKMGLDYLSWANAHSIIQEHFPGSYEEVGRFPNPNGESGFELEALYYPGGTAEVAVTLHILVNGTEISMSETLPVMDKSGQNKAIVEPTTREINDAKKRCFVKCAALFGLGLHLWTNDALPRKDSDTQEEQKESVNKKTSNKKAKETKKSKEAKETKANGVKNPVSAVFDELVLDNIKTMEELTAAWKSNKDALDTLKENSPKDYQTTVNLFKSKKQLLEEGMRERIT